MRTTKRKTGKLSVKTERRAEEKGRRNGKKRIRVISEPK